MERMNFEVSRWMRGEIATSAKEDAQMLAMGCVVLTWQLLRYLLASQLVCTAVSRAATSLCLGPYSSQVVAVY